MIRTGFLYTDTEIFEYATAVDRHLGENDPAPSQVSLLQGALRFCVSKLHCGKAADAHKNNSVGRTLTRCVHSFGVSMATK